MRAATAAAAFAMLTLSPHAAEAFCAKTTCDPTREECPADEHGCVRQGARVRWSSTTLAYRLPARGSYRLAREEAREAIRAAFHRWSDAICADGRRTSLRFEEREDVVADKPLAPGVQGEAHSVYFRDLGWPYEGREDSTYAQTNLAVARSSGLVQYADIEINSGAAALEGDPAQGGVDLQAVMTHEVGHFLGLAHSDDPSSIMLPEYCRATDARCARGKLTARRLSRDDIAGVCELFPPGARGALVPAEQAGCTVARPRSATSSTLPLVAVALAAGLACARRARRDT